MLGCAAQAPRLSAQDRNAPPTLEDLIPDAAVENPEAWAAQGTSDAAQGSPDAAEALDPDTPLDETSGIAVGWPDDLELPPVTPLEPEEGIRFAEVEGDPLPALPDAELERITGGLVLAFPAGEESFPLKGEFVRRFEGLSTIEELGDADGNIAQLAARARADEALLNELLRVYGYYDAQVVRTVGGTAADRDAGAGEGAETAEERGEVRFDILPGTRYRFDMIDLGQLDAAPDAAALRGAFEIRPGDPLSSDKIVEEQFDLDRALGETGYPFAEIDEPALLIDHDRAEGDLTMAVRPNGKFVFGEVNSNLPGFLSSRHLARIARFDPGDVYQRSLSFDLRRAITATGLVSTVTVTPREVTPPQGDEPGVVALDVEMTKAPLRTIAGAIGYGSAEGIRVQASWEHRNLFPPEGSLRLRGIAGTREQLLGVTYRRNNFRGRDKVLTADAYASSIDTDAYDARTVALRGSYERLSNLLFQKDFSWSVGAEVLATDERNRVISGIPRPRQTYLVGSVFGRATLDGTDSLLDPKKGYRVTLFAAPEISRSFGTQSTYVRLQLDASAYQPVGERVVLAGRTRLATIPGAATFRIAPSRRLYAGGGSSVRGYGYQAIGPINDLGEPTGGRSLVELSAEARIKTGFMDGAVSVVPFIDAGTVSLGSTPDFRFIKYGAGAGVRYETGFGPIRVDVGVPLNPGQFDSSVAVYVSLGQAF